MKKLKLLIAACALVVGAGQAWADNTSVLTDNGWRLVSSITDVADNYYVFVDAGNLDNAMARTTNGRPVYTTLADPVSNPGFVWILDGSESYTLQSLSDEYFFYAGSSGWNNSMSLTQSSAFTFTVAEGIYKLETTANISYNASSEGKYVGAWDGPSYSFNQDNNTAHLIVTNKSADKAGSFKVYSISRSAYAKKYLTGATSESPKDASIFIVNPSFETGNTTGWNHGSSADTGAKNYDLNPGKDGTYVFNSWWTGVPLTQTIANLPNGTYTLSAYIGSSDDSNDGKVFLTANGDHSTVFTFTTKTQNVGVLCSYEFNVTNHSATIGIVGGAADGSYVEGGYWWYKVDNFKLSYKGEDLSSYVPLLSAAVAKAQALVNGNTIPDAAETALQTVINANDNDDSAFTEGDEYTNAINAINTAYDTYVVLESPYATFNALKTDANAIGAVEYTDITDGSHSTFSTAITNRTSTVEGATTASTIEAATTALKADIKTYIAGAKPKSESEYFDITCLITNPGFDDNTITGWTRTIDQASGYNAVTNYSCNECWNCTFNFYQDITNLPSGSYQLSVQAFSRPGDNGNTTAGAYYDYYNGTNNVTAELYLTSGGTTQASKVGNIYAYKESTAEKAGSNFNCTGLGTDDYYVPNDMQSASAYFAAGAYTTEVATRVTEAGGTMRLGFRDTDLTTHQWTIFDNFKLYYYGPSLARYYQQYLPQLEAEITADYLENAAYNVLKTDQTERADLVTANSADAATLSTESDFDNAITAITTARDNFVAAKEAYDELSATITDAGTVDTENNVGDGIFQLSRTKADALASAITTAQEVYDTGTASKSAVETATGTLETAYTLNAPDADKHYVLTFHSDGHESDGYAVTFISGVSTEGTYGIKYLASANTNLMQAIKFTAVSGNNYKMSFIRTDGAEQYITTKLLGYSDGGHGQIRTTDDASKALVVKIKKTSTDNQFQLYNTEASASIAHNGNNNNDMYTANSANFTIAEASRASVDVAIASTVKYATRIFPFAPTLPTGVKAYTAEVSGDVVNLSEAATPAANTPYVLYAESGYSGDALTGWGTAAATSYDSGVLTGVYENTTAPNDSYILANVDNAVGFYQVDNGSKPTVGANRCYLTAPSPSRALFFSQDATGIDAINALTSGEAKIYNASGVRVPALQKGMNIMKMKNGTTQKIMVK